MTIYIILGIAIITKDLSLIIVEGGPKSQKKFNRLMLHRIKWDEDSAQGIRQDKIDKKNQEVKLNRKMNHCKLLWEVSFLYSFPFFLILFLSKYYILWYLCHYPMQCLFND